MDKINGLFSLLLGSSTGVIVNASRIPPGPPNPRDRSSMVMRKDLKQLGMSGNLRAGKRRKGPKLLMGDPDAFLIWGDAIADTPQTRGCRKGVSGNAPPTHLVGIRMTDIYFGTCKRGVFSDKPMWAPK